MPPFVLGDIIGGRTPAPRYQLNPSPQTLGRGFKAPRRPFSASNWPLPIVNRPRGAMNFEVIFTASGPLAGAGARPGRLYPSTCASKPASAKRGGDVCGGDHGAVAHPGAALGQVDVGLVDAGQVVQHEHHGVGGVLVGEAGDVERWSRAWRDDAGARVSLVVVRVGAAVGRHPWATRALGGMAGACRGAARPLRRVLSSQMGAFPAPIGHKPL
jgi:hypothetical protein